MPRTTQQSGPQVRLLPTTSGQEASVVQSSPKGGGSLKLHTGVGGRADPVGLTSKNVMASFPTETDTSGWPGGLGANCKPPTGFPVQFLFPAARDISLTRKPTGCKNAVNIQLFEATKTKTKTKHPKFEATKTKHPKFRNCGSGGVKKPGSIQVGGAGCVFMLCPSNCDGQSLQNRIPPNFAYKI